MVVGQQWPVAPLQRLLPDDQGHMQVPFGEHWAHMPCCFFPAHSVCMLLTAQHRWVRTRRMVVPATVLSGGAGLLPACRPQIQVELMLPMFCSTTNR
jgi:hypothetical protein